MNARNAYEIHRANMIHQRKLMNMKPSLKIKKPKVYAHLKNKRKKQQLQEEQFEKIEYENRLLLQKMARIMRTSTLDNKNRSKKFGRSLNNTKRKQELEKITEENQRLLLKLQKNEPTLTRESMEKDFKQTRRYLRNMQPKMQLPSFDEDYLLLSRERMEAQTDLLEFLPQPGDRRPDQLDPLY
eukprot:TRINITY_DN780172_c0_g1_i1.p1 TRINITY_DN780172_c0_g1~~TRINITY_DN780172_c0_g1_i1.p1  ORF type:complete len:184 (+),score=29.54 TRINITY_DN780172_c0_g1_i1:107-658(+)